MGWNREPVAIAGAIRAVILCAVAFGLKWSPEQIAAVMLAVEAVLTLVTRQSVVTPNTLEKAGTSKAQIVADAAAANVPSR